MNNINYFQATSKDILLIVDYRIKFLINLMGMQPQSAIDELRKSLNEYFSHSLKLSTYICWMAKNGDEIVGIGGLAIREHPGNFRNISGRVGYIMNMYTTPSHRRMGICSNILNRLTESAKEMGIYTFELHATIEGEAVYKKNGFVIHPEPTYKKHLVIE